MIPVSRGEKMETKMDLAQLEQDINAAWDSRDTIGADTTGPVRDAVSAALEMLDNGTARVAEPRGDHQWHVNQWLKKAVLLSFRLNDMAVIPSGTAYPGHGEAVWWDKVPSKFAGWGEAEFRKAHAYPNGVAKLPLKAPPGAQYGLGEGYSSDGLLLAAPTFDIWSFGVVLYFAIAHKPLLETTGSDQLRGKAERTKLAKWTTEDLTYAINDLDHGECARVFI